MKTPRNGDLLLLLGAEDRLTATVRERDSDMTTYADKPWLELYADGSAGELEREHNDGLDMFRQSLERAPDMPAIAYFDGRMTFAELDAATDALAAALVESGFAPGDRLALYTQNDPAFVIGLLAAWKAAGVAVAVNPMNKSRELRYILADSGATALLCLDSLHDDVARDVLAQEGMHVPIVITYTARDFQTRDDERVLEPARSGADDGRLTLTSCLRQHAGRRVPAPDLEGSSVAILTYTSGTTGEPKGAMNTHGNLVFNALVLRKWMDLEPGDGILAVAPLFHITGLVGHAILALLTPGTLILGHRFQPDVMLDAIREHRPTFTVGAITAFASLAGARGIGPDDMASVTRLYSGGAAIAPAVADRLEAVFGKYVHNAYGLTESSSVTHLVPLGRRAPVDPVSGALSIGVPVFSTSARIVDESGDEVPVGDVGELLISGPQVVPGYWGKPEASSESIPNGELRTGDVAFMDQEGWFYLVDRKKDMINAAGYKVWPREVEDVLYTHPAVREAAVVGVPDDYRGETVKAFVSLKDGSTATPDEIVAFCRDLMAAYKYPREVVVVEDLPKTATGKILRRQLREVHPRPADHGGGEPA